jgi:hypothetical protein
MKTFTKNLAKFAVALTVGAVAGVVVAGLLSLALPVMPAVLAGCLVWGQVSGPMVARIDVDD